MYQIKGSVYTGKRFNSILLTQLWSNWVKNLKAKLANSDEFHFFGMGKLAEPYLCCKS